MRLRYVAHVGTGTCELRAHLSGGERVSERLVTMLSPEVGSEYLCRRIDELRYDVSGLVSLRRLLRTRGLGPGMLNTMLSDVLRLLDWSCEEGRAALEVPYDARYVLVGPDQSLRFVAFPVVGVYETEGYLPQTLLRSLCSERACRLCTPTEIARAQWLHSCIEKSFEGLSVNEVREILRNPGDEGSAAMALHDMATRERFELVPGVTYLMGRASTCDISLPMCAHVSRRHARVTCDESSVRIVDLGSANGVTVGGVRIEPYKEQRLVAGSCFALAGREFTVSDLRGP